VISGVRRITSVVAAALILTSCAGVRPALTDRGYAEKAVTTARTVHSAVENARLVADLVLHNRITRQYADVSATESEHEALEAQAAFDSVQPTSRKVDDLRERLDGVLTEATSALTDLRIAVRRHAIDDVRRAAEDLADASGALEALGGD
jgi:hypothetical protein